MPCSRLLLISFHLLNTVILPLSLSGLKNQDSTVRGMRTPSPENGKRELSLSLLLLFLFQQESAAALRLYEQESPYSGIQVSTAWRLDREMRRRLILQET